MPAPKMPALIRVGHRTLKVIVSKPSEMENGDRGHYEPADSRIRIASDLAAQDIAETAIHELLHACFPAFTLPAGDDDREEIVVSVIASHLAQVIRDNPELIGWLQHNLA